MGPDFKVIHGTWEKEAALGVARHLIIDLNKAFLALEAYLYPVTASWRNHRASIFLGIDTLPNRLFSVNVSNRTILNELELRGDPL